MWLNDETVGSVQGDVFYNVPAGGESGSLTYSARANDSSAVVFVNSGFAGWSTPSDWTEAGSMSLTNLLDIPGVTDWNVSGLFFYGESSYGFRALQTPLSDATNIGFVAETYGGYGGDWYEWWGSIDDSRLIVDYTLVGTATGNVSYHVPAGGSEGVIGYGMELLDGNANRFLLSRGMGDWGSMSAWTEAGAMSLQVYMDMPTVTGWNVTGAFHYGSNRYGISIQELSLGTDPSIGLLVEGYGGYGGDWYDW